MLYLLTTPTLPWASTPTVVDERNSPATRSITIIIIIIITVAVVVAVVATATACSISNSLH